MVFEALFADDLELFASSAQVLQRMITIFDDIVRQFGQQISVTKTKVMIVRLESDEERIPDQPIQYCVGNEVIEVVDRFKYLGGLETEDAKMMAEIEVRKQRMLGAYARYERDIFDSCLSERCKVNLWW